MDATSSPFATRLTAVDASPEVIALNPSVWFCVCRGIVADLFNWTSTNNSTLYSLVLALSRTAGTICTFLANGEGSVTKWAGLFVDSLFTQESTARNHAALNQQGYSQRKLNDGRTYRVRFSMNQLSYRNR